MELDFSLQIFRKIFKYQISWKSVQLDLVVFKDGGTDGHDEAHSRFFQF